MARFDKELFAVPEGFDRMKEGVTYGKIAEISYDSKTTGTTRKANIILPPEFDENKRYPVLYLLHGIGGDHNEWLGAEPVYVLSNLVAEGKAEEMIVVIPNVRARANDAGNPQDIYTPEHYKAFDNFINNSGVFTLFRAVNLIVVVDTDNRLIGWNGDNVQLVDFLEFSFLSHSCTGHTGELIIKTEEILECYCSKSS